MKFWCANPFLSFSRIPGTVNEQSVACSVALCVLVECFSADFHHVVEFHLVT